MLEAYVLAWDGMQEWAWMTGVWILGFVKKGRKGAKMAGNVGLRAPCIRITINVGINLRIEEWCNQYTRMWDLITCVAGIEMGKNVEIVDLGSIGG